MSLLPSRRDAPDAGDAEPRVVGVESDDADALLAALSSETARRLLAELHESPAPPAELADRVDTSLQNVQYHLKNLREAGVVEVVDTAYSEKGREMDVYAPADQPLVIFAGDQDSTASIRTALSRLLGGFGLLAIASLAVQEVFGGGIGELLPGGWTGGGGGAVGPATTSRAAAAGDGSTTPTPEPTAVPTRAGGTPIETAEATRTATETAAGGLEATAAGVPPGLIFFLGGATVLLAGFAVWYLQR